MKAKRVSSLLLAGALTGCNAGAYSVQSAALPTVAPDQTPPRVIQFSPANGATDVAIRSSVQITLDEDLAQHCIDAEHIRLYAINQPEPVHGQVSFDTEQNLLVFIPEKALQYDTDYRLYLGESLSDVAGNRLTSVYSTFSTRAANQEHMLTDTDNCEPVCDLEGLQLESLSGDDSFSADFERSGAEDTLNKKLEHVDSPLEQHMPDDAVLELADQPATEAQQPELLEQIQRLTSEDDLSTPSS